jgi:preprotein translocase subunit SecA
MIGYIIKKVIGSKNDREVKRLRRDLVPKINTLEEQFQSLTDEQLRAKTAELKQRIEEGRKTRGYYELMESAHKLDIELRGDEAKTERRKAFDIEQTLLTEILPDAFAAVKNACRRLCGRDVLVCGHPVRWEMVPFDTSAAGRPRPAQGAHRGNGHRRRQDPRRHPAGLPERPHRQAGVHVVTVNDYLARRDSEWMGAVYTYLGLTVGCIQNQMRPPSARAVRLRHHLRHQRRVRLRLPARQRHGLPAGGQVQRGYYFAIVDEVDSILIDEARTPLIISGPAMVTYDNDYAKYKPQVASLVHAQERLCQRYLNEAEQLLRKFRPEDGSNPQNPDELAREIGRLLFRVKLGFPKSEGLAKLIENPENLKLMNAAELELHADQKKKQLYAEKEELFFGIDEKSHEADLTEKGRNFLSPKIPTPS